jgi:hypothetical protein
MENVSKIIIPLYYPKMPNPFITFIREWLVWKEKGKADGNITIEKLLNPSSILLKLLALSRQTCHAII